MDSTEDTAAQHICENQEIDQLNPPPASRHQTGYLEMIIFLVEGTLFKVPKFKFLLPGTTFQKAYNVQVGDGPLGEGMSDDLPLRLSGVTEEYFHGFLLALYPYQRTPSGYKEWLGALDLATLWHFEQIRQSAIDALSLIIKNRNVLGNVILAKKYKVKQWLLDSYQHLVTKETLTATELREPHQLDWETIARILSIRAEINPSPRKVEPPTPSRPKTRCTHCQGLIKNSWKCPYTCRNMGFNTFDFESGSEQEQLGVGKAASIEELINREFGGEFKGM